MLPPDRQRARGLVDAERVSTRVARSARAQTRATAAARRSPASPRSTAQPWRTSLDHLAEREAQRGAGSAGSPAPRRKFESGVGFSNGCAEFTLKNPPPLVPSCLIAICDAAGPQRRGAASVTGRRRAWIALRAASPCAYGRKFCTTPWDTSEQRQHEPTAAAGCTACRASGRPRSCRWSIASRADEAADQRDQHRHAGRRRDEVLHGERRASA